MTLVQTMYLHLDETVMVSIRVYTQGVHVGQPKVQWGNSGRTSDF